MTIVVPTTKQNRNQAITHCIVIEIEAQTKIKMGGMGISSLSAHTHQRSGVPGARDHQEIDRKSADQMTRILITKKEHRIRIKLFPFSTKVGSSDPYSRCLVKLKRRPSRDHDGGQTFLAGPPSSFSFLLALSLPRHLCYCCL